jgi:hypothetical protein
MVNKDTLHEQTKKKGKKIDLKNILFGNYGQE